MRGHIGQPLGLVTAFPDDLPAPGHHNSPHRYLMILKRFFCQNKRFLHEIFMREDRVSTFLQSHKT
ncbi:hypothetical protein D9M68_978760 [compost metagenome]